MQIRLEKEEPTAVPFSEIPVGHVGRNNNARVLRCMEAGVYLETGYVRHLNLFHATYIDEGPLQLPQPKPKLVPFADIPVGHVGKDKNGDSYLRLPDGGVGLNALWSGFIRMDCFGGNTFQDLGKLIIEDV